MKKVTILHVFTDDKFFDATSQLYDQLKGVKNLYYFYTKDRNYKFQRIKRTKIIKIINDITEYRDLFSNESIDIIFFYSLRPEFNNLFKYIGKDKIVIWWAWGCDIYYPFFFNDIAPLIPCNLYKPLTLKYLQEHNKANEIRIRGIKQIFNWIRHKYLHMKIIRRVDYFIPCLPIDYNLLKQNCFYFRAKQFPYAKSQEELSFAYHNYPQNILIGNSLTYTNNHLDIIEKIRNYKITSERKFIIPINYGSAFENSPQNLISISSLKEGSTIWLTKFINKDEYLQLFDNISHAIFGVIRQQALGNIFQCLSKGIKIYLYKDSVVAKYLKEKGYFFYYIDDDLTEASLSTCLSQEKALYNYELIKKEYNENTIKTVQKKIADIFPTRF